MRKTKKEKLAAVVRRQKEFERIKLTLDFFKKSQEPQKTEEAFSPFNTTQTVPKVEETVVNLTNLSYLPKQLIKIGIITLALISAQIILYLTIL